MTNSEDSFTGSRRRRWSRHEIDLRVRMIFEQNQKQEYCHGRMVDICEGGIGLVVLCELALGQITQLEFTLPGTATPFRIRAIVRAKSGFRHGFEFLSLGLTQRQEIIRFVSQTRNSSTYYSRAG